MHNDSLLCFGIFPFLLLQLHFEIVFCWIEFGSVVVTLSCGQEKTGAIPMTEKDLFDFFLPVNFHKNLFLLLLWHSNLCFAHWGIVWVTEKWVMQIFKISLMLSIYFPTFFSPPVLLSVFFLFIFHRNKLFFLSPFFLPFLYSFQLRR